MAAPSVMYYGSTQPPPAVVPLRAGPLSLVYENGDLRYIRLGSREIIRRIYMAVRDHNWGTAAHVLDDVQMRIELDSFAITYQVHNQHGDIDFAWAGSIQGSADGVISFGFRGEARSIFRRNRLGFCVLHPIRECAGAACTLEHIDGTRTETTFPKLVAPQLYVNGLPTPHQPFASLAAMTHTVAPGVRAEVRFEGEVFELEDQRNWIDASYKTYCTPLALPFPVEVAQGTLIEQRIQVRLEGAASVSALADNRIHISARPDAPLRTLPRLGIGLNGDGTVLTAAEIERVRALNLTHVRADVALDQAGWQERLAQFAADAAACALPVEWVLTISDAAEAELLAFAQVMKTAPAEVFAYTVWHRRELVTDGRWVKLARIILDREPRVPIGAGSKANFAELNRGWPDSRTWDFITFTANPQVHARDLASVRETPSAFPALLATARQHSGGKPLALSPLTLRQPFNPVATGPEIPPPPGTLPNKVDPRQVSLFGAGWTLACLKYLGESGFLHHVTLYEATGWLGVMERAQGSPLPEQFPSLPGGVYPLYHVLADVGAMAGALVLPLLSSDPLKVEALALHKGTQRRVLLANLEGAQATVRLPEWSGTASVRVLDEHTFVDACSDPVGFRAQTTPLLEHSLHLPPYALACIDYSE
jgi:D-apionolactonase